MQIQKLVPQLVQKREKGLAEDNAHSRNGKCNLQQQQNKAAVCSIQVLKIIQLTILGTIFQIYVIFPIT